MSWLTGWPYRKSRPISALGSIAGTIAVTNGSAAVVGTSTFFRQWGIGHQIQLPNGNWYAIATITDDTHLTVSVVYPGSNASGQTYDMRLINYQKKLLVGESSGSGTNDVHCEGHCLSNFSDLKFTDSDGITILNHWIESVSGATPNQVATVWIKFDLIATAPTTFYIYFGNNSISTDPVNAPLTHQWKKYASNPILAVGAAGQWDDWWVALHSIWKEGSTYYGYYNGRKSSTQMQIGLATSADGISWSKNGGNPILAVGAAGQWDEHSVGSPLVWKEGSVWYMLYNADNNAGTVGIGLATSADGISWSKSGSNPVMACGGVGTWDRYNIAPGTAILKEGSTYYLYYSGNNAAGSPDTGWQIGLATSTDLISWTKSGNNPVLVYGASTEWDYGAMEPCVIKFGSTYYMFYQGEGKAAAPSRTRIGIASSATKDSGWVKGANNPIHDNSLGGWDNKWTEVPIVIQVGTEWRLYYAGSQGAAATPRSQSGYAVYTIDGGQGTFELYDNFDGGRTGELWSENGTPTQAGTTLTLNAAAEGIKSLLTFLYNRFRARINFPAYNNAAYRNWAGFKSTFDQMAVQGAEVTPVGGATTNIYNANYLTAYDSASLGAHSGDQIWEIDRFYDRVKDYLDASLLREDTTANTIPSASLSARFLAGIVGNYYSAFTVEWVFVAALVSVEPGWQGAAWSDEEVAPVAPTVTTQSPTSVAETSCTGHGNITVTGGANSTRRGFCYMEGSSGDPTIADSVAYDDGDFGVGAYTKAITGLSGVTDYRIRAYAVNPGGVGYGATVGFTTPSGAVPVVILISGQ